VPLELSAGEQVDVELRYRTGTGDGFGDADIASITFQLNADHRSDEDQEFAGAVELAAASDVAVVVVGTTEEVESEGFDRDDLTLPGRQDELVRAVVAANPRTVVVVNAGAPVLLPWADEVPAVLLVWFPGQEAGHALADVITGAVEPGGRLPTTWPVDESAPLPGVRPVDGRLDYAEGLHVGHRGYERAGVAPRYWFGHGLGYTTWEYVGADLVPTGMERRGWTYACATPGTAPAARWCRCTSAASTAPSSVPRAGSPASPR
jgi:beta-glucosidase